MSDNNLNKKELFVDNYNVDNNESNDERVIKLLNKYKSLLDNGVITQEEFNEKKQTLLKNY
ncbi:MAG TPA: SHOCT domain-containing protein [Clostridia bacterium]|nr:SHOCT domain-containing protein [Clostridia bacterium]